MAKLEKIGFAQIIHCECLWTADKTINFSSFNKNYHQNLGINQFSTCLHFSAIDHCSVFMSILNKGNI